MGTNNTKNAASEFQFESAANSEDKFLIASKTRYEMASHELDVASFDLHVLEQLINAGKIDENTAKKIKLCFQEALTNSLDHGNLELESVWKEEIDASGVDLYERIKKQRLADKNYSTRLIFVEAEFDGSKLAIQIKDQGKGFDISKKIKEASENEENHGRGLYLMNEILDEISYSKGGTEVLLIKNLKNG